MKELIASVSEQGQVTIPAEVRRQLGLEPRDKVVFAITEDRIELKPMINTLETA